MHHDTPFTPPHSQHGGLPRRTALVALAGLAAGATGPFGVWAQATDRPVRLILPVSAGSGVDGLARAFGPSLGKSLGRPVVVENWAVSRAPP